MVNPRQLILGAIATLILALFSYEWGLALTPATPPPLPIHPLPPSLAQWHDSQESGDYFDAISPVSVGYLIWSDFPLQVYLDPVDAPENKAVKSWISAVETAMQEWQTYLPLEISPNPEQADILIHRQRPPLQWNPNGPLERVRAATTRYQLYHRSRPHHGKVVNFLAHRCEIFLTPDQTPDYTLATARHELGHALGIWGHSPEPTDALYFAQVRNPPGISARDLNTLKRIYQQPTRLGWPAD